MVTYALATPAKERSLGGLLVAGAIGAATGALTVGIGAKVAPLVGAVARVAGAKIAQGVARTAVQKVVGASARAVPKIGGGSVGRAAAVASSCATAFHGILSRVVDWQVAVAWRPPVVALDLGSFAEGRVSARWRDQAVVTAAAPAVR
jgi:hypothetical protein